MIRGARPSPHAAVSVVLAAVVLAIPSQARAHGFDACGYGVKVFNISCNQAINKVLAPYIGSGFRDHKRHGWRCRGSLRSDGAGGLPGKIERRSQTVNCTRERRPRGHQHIKARS